MEKTKGIKVGDFVFKDYGIEFATKGRYKRYRVGLVHRVDECQSVGDSKVYCKWGDTNKLPKTISEFEAVKKDSLLLWAWEGNTKKFTLRSNANIDVAIRHIVNGNQTIVIIPNGDGTYLRGVARCHPEDEFMGVHGFLVAYARALGKEIEDFVAKDEIKEKELCEYSDEDIIAELDYRLRKRS